MDFLFVFVGLGMSLVGFGTLGFRDFLDRAVA
jgi:hypothetical protein